jgi:hypothetical protein
MNYEIDHKNDFGLSIVLELKVENSKILTYVKNWRNLSQSFIGEYKK